MFNNCFWKKTLLAWLGFLASKILLDMYSILVRNVFASIYCCLLSSESCFFRQICSFYIKKSNFSCCIYLICQFYWYCFFDIPYCCSILHRYWFFTHWFPSIACIHHIQPSSNFFTPFLALLSATNAWQLFFTAVFICNVLEAVWISTIYLILFIKEEIMLCTLFFFGIINFIATEEIFISVISISLETWRL